MESGGIYQIRNVRNGKVYIGSTVNFETRFYQHRRELNKGKHHSRKLQQSWNECGSDAFVFEVLEIAEFDDRQQLYQLEQEYIDRLLPHKFGFNMAPFVNDVTITRSSKYHLKPVAGTYKIKIKLAALLHERDMGQRELSRRTGIRQATISDMCLGKVMQLALDNLARICEALNVGIGDILKIEKPEG